MSEEFLPQDFNFEAGFEPGISFHAEEIDFSLDNEELVADWIREIIENESKELGFINYVFCSDEYLHQINIEYLNHDTYTDIITFPLSEHGAIESDIFISIDRVKENAGTFNAVFERELYRVIVHGVLHLCGYGDKTEEQAALMRKKENDAIEMFFQKYI